MNWYPELQPRMSCIATVPLMQWLKLGEGARLLQLASSSIDERVGWRARVCDRDLARRGRHSLDAVAVHYRQHLHACYPILRGRAQPGFLANSCACV